MLCDNIMYFTQKLTGFIISILFRINVSFSVVYLDGKVRMERVIARFYVWEGVYHYLYLLQL